MPSPKPTGISIFFVCRTDPNARPELVAGAEQWERQYQAGEACACLVCKRPFTLPEPPPLHCVVVGVFDPGMISGFDANAVVGGVCNDCAKKGNDFCVSAVSRNVLGAERVMRVVK